MSISRRDLLKGAAVAGAAAALPTEAEARHNAEVLPEAVGMLFDATKCVGCRGCQTACKVANKHPTDTVTAVGGVYDAPNDLNGSTQNIIKAYVSDDGQKHAYMKQQCMHCVDPSCVSVCMMGALHKEGAGKRDLFDKQDRGYAEKLGTGIVLYDRGLCVGCRYCQIGCAFNVPRFQWDDPIPLIVKCELCNHRRDPKLPESDPKSVANPACCEVCPAEAVIYGKRSELLATAKARLAADPKKYNPHIYGETEGGGTQVLYLAPADVSFKELGLPELPARASASFSEGVSHAPYLYGITPLALYAGLAYVIKKNHDKEEHGEGK